LVHLVYLVYLVSLVRLVVWINQTNETNKTNQTTFFLRGADRSQNMQGPSVPITNDFTDPDNQPDATVLFHDPMLE
jgi:hypothetical protein